MDEALASGRRLFRVQLRSGSRQAHSRQGSQYVLFVAGRLLRLWSVYVLFSYLVASNVSVVLFMFACLLGFGAVLLVLQRPWVGRRLSNSQIGPSLLNGAVLALAVVCWAKGLVLCGPVRTVLAEYSGAVVGASSTLVLGRGGHKLRKAGGLVAMLLVYYLVMQGWTTSSSTPIDLGPMSLCIVSGILMALRRTVARRVTVTSVLKRRLHSITAASAACFLFPFAMYQLTMGEAPLQGVDSSATAAYLSTLVFGMIMAFYVESYAEDRLDIHTKSPLHFLFTFAGLILLELFHGMDFSFVGFLICASVLGIGISEATTTSEIPMVLPTVLPDVVMTSGPSRVAP